MEAMTSSGLPVPSTLHSFSQVPAVEKPRSSFDRSSRHKTTFEAGYYVPLYWDAVLPGDTFEVFMKFFIRLLSALMKAPMDDLFMDLIAIYAPNRILWSNYERQQGSRDNPSSSIDFLTPQVNPPSGGWPTHSLADYFWAQVGVEAKLDAYLFRMYNLFYNQWVRNENIINSLTVPLDDGPDDPSLYTLKKRMKRPDYFVSALPWAQKGTPVEIPVAGTAPVVFPTDFSILKFDVGGPQAVQIQFDPATSTVKANFSDPSATVDAAVAAPTDAYVAGNNFTGITVNDFRLLVTTQQVLEIDARSGTRMPEILAAHWGVTSPDARLQRVEFLGATTFPLNIHPIVQTSETATTPQGNIAGFSTGGSTFGFTHSFVESGHIMVLGCIRAALTYQQGTPRELFKRTRYDYYLPVFANIGEQAVLRREIFTTSDGAGTNELVFGYQEYAAEYRYMPNTVSGLFRTDVTAGFASLDVWHLGQHFSSAPTLSQSFIEENVPISRVVADEDEPFFMCDMAVANRTTRVMPVFSVPGLHRV